MIRFVATLALWLASVVEARASERGPRVVVLVDEPVAAEVRSALPSGTRLASADAFVAAWHRAGGPGSPSVPPIEAADRGARATAVARVKRAARDVDADAVVMVRVEAVGRARARRARVVIVTADDEEPRVDATLALAARGSNGSVGRTVEDGMRDVAPPAEPEPPAPPPAPPPRPTAAATASDAPTRDGGAPSETADGAWLDFAAGFELGARDFRYTSRVTPNLREYAIGATPILAAGGTAYFARAPRDSVMPDVGITASFANALGARSATSAGASVATRWTRFSVGPRVRRRFDVEGGLALGAAITYGEETFAFDDAPADLAPELASVSYRVVRPSLDARLDVGRFAAFAGVAYLGVLAAGDVGERFPNASVFGLEASLGGGVTIVRGLEVRLAADYRRFVYALSPSPGSAYLAGGALDELMGASIALAYLR